MNKQPPLNNTRSLLRVGLVANIFETYEWAFYSYLAPIIGQLFLQETDTQTLYIRSYLIFMIGFFARPLGSIIWGYYADRVGRSHSLKGALLFMSIPTALIGMLPTYNYIGWWATLSFLMLRLMQGFAHGGEYSVSGCYIYESTDHTNRSLLCSVVGASGVIGMLCGSFVVALLFWYFPRETILQWAWRLPYLLGICIIAWIASARKSIQEPPRPSNFALKPESNTTLTRKEMYEFILRLILVVLVIGFMQTCSYTLFVWLPSYLTHFLGIDASVAQFVNVVGLLVWAGLIVLAGYLSSIFGYKRIIAIHTIAMIVMIIPLFKLLQVGTYGALLSAYILFAWLQSGVPAVTMEVLGDAFPRKVRALGMSLGQTLSATIFGGTVPWINSMVITKTGLVLFPAFYIACIGILILPVIPYLKRVEA